MKLTVMQPVEIEAVAIRIAVPINHGEEDIPADFPGRIADVWHATIDIDTGKVHKWPIGRVGECSMKVVDQGNYYLLNKAGKKLAEIEGDYVPDCIPGSYGDYIEFNIDGDGIVNGWQEVCHEESVKDSFFRDKD